MYFLFIHKDQKLIEYEIVDKTISKTNNLKRHKDHKCKPCGKSFTQAASLRNHIQTIHEGHKDQKFKSCGKSFSQVGNLKKHIHTIHEGHKDHKCDSCSKYFVTFITFVMSFLFMIIFVAFMNCVNVFLQMSSLGK